MAGRAATTKVYVGDHALSVGMPGSTEPPRGWKWTPLSELAEMATGHTPSRNVPAYWGGDIKWMCAGDARFQHGGVVYDTHEKITHAGIDNSAAVVLPTDTVCLARTGASIGYAVRLGEPMATNQGFVNWICGKNLLPKFLQYILVAEIDFLERIAYGAAHHTIYFPELKAFHVCVPPLSEQRRIVGILDEAFAGIATAKANVGKNLRNARELFESYLHAAFTRRAEKWPRRALVELCYSDRVITYGVIKLGNEVSDGVPCLRTSNVRWLSIETEGMKRIARTLSDEFRRTILGGGEVLVNVRGTLGGVCVASPEMAGWNVSREVAVVPSDPARIDPYYLAYWIGTHESQTWLGAVKKGAAYVGINIEDLRLLPVPHPNLAEQRTLVAQLDSVRVESLRLQTVCAQKIDAIDALKQSLLQEAFSGQLSTKFLSLA